MCVDSWGLGCGEWRAVELSQDRTETPSYRMGDAGQMWVCEQKAGVEPQAGGKADGHRMDGIYGWCSVGQIPQGRCGQDGQAIPKLLCEIGVWG